MVASEKKTTIPQEKRGTKQSGTSVILLLTGLGFCPYVVFCLLGKLETVSDSIMSNLIAIC